MTNQSEHQNTELTRLIEEIIDKGANTAEEINRAVLDLPVTVLDSLGLENTATEVPASWFGILNSFFIIRGLPTNG